MRWRLAGIVRATAPAPARDEISTPPRARDIALGLGALAALRNSGPARPRLVADALSDAFDIGSSVAAWQELPRVTRWLVVASAGGATLAWGAGALAERPAAATRASAIPRDPRTASTAPSGS